MKKSTALSLDDYILAKMEKYVKKGIKKTEIVEKAFEMWEKNEIEIEPASIMKSQKKKIIVRVYRLSEKTLEYKKKATEMGISIRRILYSGFEKIVRKILQEKKKR